MADQKVEEKVVAPAQEQPVAGGSAGDEAPAATSATQPEGERAEGEQQADNGEAVPQTPQVTIRLPSPSNSRTLPKSTQPLNTLALLPQPQETIQELKLAINDWIGGYWLGPYSLRIPASKGASASGNLLSKGKDGVEVRAGEKLSDWMEVGDVFSWAEEGDERVLEVVREPYSDFSARQTVLRLIDLIMPVGTTANHLATPLGLSAGSTIFESVRDGRLSAASGSSQPVYEEVEVALPSGRKGKAGKKEVVKVKREVATDASNPFADWKADWAGVDLGKLPMAQDLLAAQSCVRSIQLSPFNPPAPHFRQAGHQLYLQVSLLEGEICTLVCTSRGWYVSKSNVNHFDPAPKTASSQADGPAAGPQYIHSLIDLLHSISPLFSDRLNQLAPLTTQPPALEPISTVPIPQAEPAYPFLASVPKPSTTPDILRTQLAYLHTGATTADALDSARDWNEEIQGIKELPREGMQEQVLREKMAQKTWAEYTSACVRAVVTVSRGDIPPLNPNEDPRGHMWLLSNIFITRAIDCIDTYAHLGGDSAAYVSHAKDAAGVKLLNKLDVDGIHLLGHTVVDWLGERWVCQSMLPGIFNRRKDELETGESQEAKSDEAGASAASKKEDWVEVGHSPSKSIDSAKSSAGEEAEIKQEVGAAGAEEPAENPLIIYGLDSEHLTSVHWDAATHKVMEKIGQAYRLAPHKVADGQGIEHEFYASAEVKALRGTDGRRYLLDLPRLSPVDIEWLEKDMDGELAGPEKVKADGAAAYPHRVVLLRPELVETFWESELKRWAREAAAKQAEEAKAQAGAESKSTESKADGEVSAAEASPADADGVADTNKDAADATAATAGNEDAPINTALLAEQLEQFELRFNPDAFVDQAAAREEEDKTRFVPSKVTDESDPSIKAVRDASVFLRSVAIPALVVDVLTGQASGVMDGLSLSKTMHQRGINMRYLGHLAQVVSQFSDNQEGGKMGYLSAFKGIVLQEMLVRASKHVLRRYVQGLAPEHVSCAISHFLNCLLGTGFNASPKASYEALELGSAAVPAYTSLSPESLRKEIVTEVQMRYRWTLSEDFLSTGVRKPQVLRELATRVAFQLVQRPYAFEASSAEAATDATSEDDKENRNPAATGAGKKRKGGAAATTKAAATPRTTTFEPSDILTCLPVVKSTAPSVSVAEQIFEAGRATINRGKMDMGLEFMLESIHMYENIHSVIHPEVAAAYNQYASTLHQLARLKIQQFSADQANGDPEQPLGLDIATALRLQRQAVIIAERTLGVWHSETLGYYLLLAMLENLEGNAAASLRYFRHVLSMWDVIYGEGHPEINTVLTNAGVVLQAINETSLSLNLLNHVEAQTTEVFGPTSIQKGQALHSLTQALFLAGDIPKALEVSAQAFGIFKARFGEDHPQTAEVGKNVELLRAVVENVERQKAATQQAKERQAERLKAVQERVAQTTAARRRLGASATTAAANGTPAAAGSSSVSADLPAGSAVPAADAAPASRIGEKGDLEIDELVKFIQGQQGAQAPKRGAKNSLRGKRRTGAKR